ncbi:hypothetical protein SAMN05660772_02426 [Pasteurella testudinis DSM 23072]|uniref:DUF551 domain-containing protein n=1 Tax=Pasteurella testudinis DSM 23072 TaxID=1122938 RepID=A0A1W1UVJ2_9PAST|nr:hypothetical protein SAMN05660772_02426 [Pasteurella testudinis DSM 23072]SUB52115.1 Uncharacterised protein [Pasteurella testudinis]
MLVSNNRLNALYPSLNISSVTEDSDPSEWISAETPPCEQGHYLCYIPYYELPYVIIEYDTDLGDFVDCGNEITYWRRLPEPPKA